jgi:DNA ligase-1
VFLDELSATAGSKRKVELLTQFLGRATPLEAKYIVKLLQADLRIGLREGAVEDAVARASATNVGSVQRCNMLLGDIGETAVLARHNALHSARMRLFHPLKFMLASRLPTSAMSRAECRRSSSSRTSSMAFALRRILHRT